MSARPVRGRVPPDGSDIVAAIPVYQGADDVAAVVASVRAACDLPVVVVDDGSTDGSGERAAAAGAVVLRHPANQGKGAALQTAFAWALRRGAAAVLTLDADGQHDAAEIPALVEAARANPGAIVIGVRRFDAMPTRSRTGNRISTYWISKFSGRPHRDSQSGFRVYPRALLDGTPFRTSRFDTETELLLRAAHLGIPLVEVPVRTIYPAGAHRSHFHGVRDTLRILGLVVSSPVWLRRDRDARGGGR